MTVWVAVIVVALALIVGAVGLWFLLRDASPHPPGQHRGAGRAARRDPHDPVIRDDELPPEEDK